MNHRPIRPHTFDSKALLIAAAPREKCQGCAIKHRSCTSKPPHRIIYAVRGVSDSTPMSPARGSIWSTVRRARAGPLSAVARSLRSTHPYTLDAPVPC
jgi:hypothetical protein